MSLLQWDDEFETGIAAADHEHGKLVDLVNSVYDRWKRDADRGRERFFDDLFNIFVSHFDFENRLMDGTGYADRDAHARDHERVLRQLRAIVARADEPGYDLKAALASCLQHWLATHIRHHDAPMYKALGSDRDGTPSIGAH